MDTTLSFLLGGLLGSLTTLWGYIKAVWLQIQSAVLVTIDVQFEAAEASIIFLNQHSQITLPIGKRKYHGRWMNIKSDSRLHMIVWEVLGQYGSLYLFGHIPILITPATSDSGPSSHATGPYAINITYLRGSLKSSDSFLTQVAAFYDKKIEQERESKRNRFYIRRITGRSAKQMNLFGGGGSGGNNSKSDSAEPGLPQVTRNDEVEQWSARSYLSARPVNADRNDIGASQTLLTVEDMYLNPAAQEAVSELRQWLKSEDWYKRHGIGWRKNWLIHSPPGMGKTTLARALAESLNMPVFVFDLSSLSNNEMIREWRNLLPYAPCMALFEDIHAIFDKSQTIEGELTFDCFLNCLSGMEQADGVFCILTTNDLNKIDPAIGVSTDFDDLPTRPGRVDRCFEMTAPDAPGRAKIAQRVLGEDFTDPQLNHIIAEGEGDSGAQFQERCIRAVMKQKREAAFIASPTDLEIDQKVYSQY